MYQSLTKCPIASTGRPLTPLLWGPPCVGTSLGRGRGGTMSSVLGQASVSLTETPGMRPEQPLPWASGSHDQPPLAPFTTTLVLL